MFAFVAIASTDAILRPKFQHIHLGLHIARSSCGWAGISLMFAAIAFIPLPDATFGSVWRLSDDRHRLRLDRLTKPKDNA